MNMDRTLEISQLKRNQLLNTEYHRIGLYLTEILMSGKKHSRPSLNNSSRKVGKKTTKLVAPILKNRAELR